MQHINPERLQQYLADSLEASEREALAAHLADCDQCSGLLSELVIDDRFLVNALALTDEEADWVADQDLTPAVLHQISSRPAVMPALFIAGIVMLPGVWMWNLVAGTFSEWLAGRGAINLMFDFGRTLLPGLGRCLLWLYEGGLLVQVWPLILLGFGLWFWRLSHIKETNEYA